MKYAYLGIGLALGGLLAWLLIVAVPIVDANAPARAYAQAIVDRMDFIRHPSGLCFGVVLSPTLLVAVPSERCDHPWEELRQQGRTP